MSSFAEQTLEEKGKTVVEQEVEVAAAAAPAAEGDFCVLNEGEDDDDESEVGAAHIQLGFAEKVEGEEDIKLLFQEPDWTVWDGGKVGGKPIWLDPLHIPTSKALQCPSCQEPLQFLLQVYCPLDNASQAFHRGLYVFCCRKKTCINTGGLKCFRVQLPKVNDFYCADPDNGAAFKEVAAPLPALCALCGCRAGNVCSSCKQISYCSRSHQKLHWKFHKKACQAASSSSASVVENNDHEAQKQHLFPEYEIVVESESENAAAADKKLTSKSAATEIWEDAMTPGGADEAGDAALTQADYNQALSEQRYDPTYVSFLTRIANGGSDQVFRYCEDSLHRQTLPDEERQEISLDNRERGRLYLSTDAKKYANKVQVPNCPHCGAARALECQIMPQLLHFLEVEKNTELIKTIVTPEAPQEGATDGSTSENQTPETAVQVKGTVQNTKNDDLDWGSIDVYTCIASCPGSVEAAYLEEFLTIQEFPDTELQVPAAVSR